MRIIRCDRCGNDTKPGEDAYRVTIEVSERLWENSYTDEYTADLCKRCAGVFMAEIKGVRVPWDVYEFANTEEEQPIAWCCRNCGEVVSVKYNYCPECGSRMGG